MSSTTTLLISVVIATIILSYHTYLIWFLPGKYTSDLRNGVKKLVAICEFLSKLV